MSKLDQYIEAATRDNTRQSYRAAIEHFEVQWKGMLPATADGVAQYLAEYADTLAVSTLRQRLAALAQWHNAQGFPDPTKAPIVRQAMRGIRALHPAQEKQAKPLQLDELERVVGTLDRAAADARRGNDRAGELRNLRDKSLILLGFWRGFRSDELSRLRVEHVEASAGEGITCFLAWTKGDRQNLGTTFRAPALSRLCPVDAYLDWIGAAQLTGGPVYRAIDRWGHVGETGLHIDSIAPLLRAILQNGGLASSDAYSGHSLRRGFANWAAADGWDVKSLMEYVGWRDIKSALRYLDASVSYAKGRMEHSVSNRPRVR
ncbi:site-specific integrase [Duganella qianjiadongensis]|uniref:Tyrosine-type recombinase/integrase n=1 Tax=Duganella qianjiadongensis TaxID=2692176 RepID=A0ABW9VSV4_9BURK|nr:site-specific integrase [Duganella qianjiadongensis]MYM42162.1 tyrosine-type recombinase/integrase [Duganella qianjiadongensis]